MIRSIVTAGAFAGLAGLGLIQQAHAQQDGENFPDGPGKAIVVSICSGCHDLARLTAGYTPEGWLSVTTMMRNFGAPGFRRSMGDGPRLSDPLFSRKAAARRGVAARSGAGIDHAMAAADARLAAARPDGGT